MNFPDTKNKNFEINFLAFIDELNYLSEKQLMIIKKRFAVSNQLLADELGVSRQRIDQLHAQAIRKIIKKEFQSMGAIQKARLFRDIRDTISKTRSETKKLLKKSV